MTSPAQNRQEPVLHAPEPEISVAHPADPLTHVGQPIIPDLCTLDLGIGGMTCASCVGRVERTLRRVPGVQDVAVNLATERARIQLLAGTPVQALIAAVHKAGYEAAPVVQEASAQAHDAQAQRQAAERQRLQRSLGWALVLALPVFILEMGGHVFPPLHGWIEATIGMRTSWLLQCVLTSAVLLGPGRQFYALGVPEIGRASCRERVSSPV